MKLIFCLQINIKGFFKLTRHAQITQNNKFAISLQNLKKEVSVKLIFCEHESFLQIDSMIFDGDGQAFQKVPK